MNRGNRTESLWEGNLPLRGSLRGPLKPSEKSLKTSQKSLKISENLLKPLKISKNLWEPLKKLWKSPSQRPSQRLSQRQVSLSEALGPVAPILLPLKLSPRSTPETSTPELVTLMASCKPNSNAQASKTNCREAVDENSSGTSDQPRLSGRSQKRSSAKGIRPLILVAHNLHIRRADPPTNFYHVRCQMMEAFLCPVWTGITDFNGN